MIHANGMFLAMGGLGCAAHTHMSISPVPFDASTRASMADQPSIAWERACGVLAARSDSGLLVGGSLNASEPFVYRQIPALANVVRLMPVLNATTRERRLLGVSYDASEGWWLDLQCRRGRPVRVRAERADLDRFREMRREQPDARVWILDDDGALAVVTPCADRAQSPLCIGDSSSTLHPQSSASEPHLVVLDSDHSTYTVASRGRPVYLSKLQTATWTPHSVSELIGSPSQLCTLRPVASVDDPRSPVALGYCWSPTESEIGFFFLGRLSVGPEGLALSSVRRWPHTLHADEPWLSQFVVPESVWTTRSREALWVVAFDSTRVARGYSILVTCSSTGADALGEPERVELAIVPPISLRARGTELRVEGLGGRRTVTCGPRGPHLSPEE